MKSEIAATLVVATLTAGVSIFGVLYNQNGSLKLETLKWEQSLAVDRAKLEREAVTEFAKAFSASYYLCEDMIWRIEMQADSLTQNEFLGYAKTSAALKPNLITSEVMLAATSSTSHSKIKDALARYRKVDEQLIIAGRRIDIDRVGVLALLNEEVKNLPALRELVLASLSNAGGI